MSFNVLNWIAKGITLTTEVQEMTLPGNLSDVCPRQGKTETLPERAFPKRLPEIRPSLLLTLLFTGVSLFRLSTKIYEEDGGMPAFLTHTFIRLFF